MRPSLNSALAACLFPMLTFLIPEPVTAAEELRFRIYAGVFNTDAWVGGEDETDTPEVGFELQLSPVTAWNLTPLLGTSANQDDAALYYTGVQWRHWVNAGWVTALSFAVALYEQGDSKDLGNDLEFRSAVEVARAFASGQALGAQFYHISNAGVADSNPGNNSLLLFYSIPFRP